MISYMMYHTSYFHNKEQLPMIDMFLAMEIRGNILSW